MQLKPLEQWICDTCGEVIKCPEDGYVQFKKGDKGGHDDFIIVHHLAVSPRKGNNKNGCYQYNADSDLKSYLAVDGLARLLALVDPGEHKCDELKHPNTGNFRKWVDFVRRLQLPYYEEARLYWSEAEQDGFFDGAGETWPYLPRNLNYLIEKYGKSI